MSQRSPSTGSIRDRWEALQARLSQTVESVTRNSRIDIVSGNVDEVDPPDDIDQYHDWYKTTGIVRANINQFVSDTVEPGVRVVADSERTEDYFNGGDAAPASTPRGGFLDNCAVRGGEKQQPFYPFLKETITQRWTRGTTLVELLKADPTDATSPITGFYHIRPETVYPRVYRNTNILLPPEIDAEAEARGLSEADVTMTRRGEVAAYIQFDDQSILGRRLQGYDRDEVPLSQNDVVKQTLDPDIGGTSSDEEGIFGTSIIEPIAEEIAEYKQIKRDRARAIKTKAYGIWGAQFNTEVHEIPGQNEVIVEEWAPEEQDSWVNEVGELGPGDILGHDGSIDLQKFEGEVPELGDTLGHLVDDILAPLPAPKYAVGFEENINQFVSNQQETRYERIIDEERRYQESCWTEVFRTVAERHPDLDPTGLRVVIEPEEEESPILSLTDEEIERIGTYTTALKDLYGPGNAPSYLSEDTLLQLVLQLSDEAAQSPDEEPQLDESDPEVQAQMDELRSRVDAVADGGTDEPTDADTEAE